MPQDDTELATAEQVAARMEMIQRLTAGCSAEEFSAMRCPICGGQLTLHVHPDRSTFFLRCSASSLHLSFHGESPAKPEWWEPYVNPTGWY